MQEVIPYIGKGAAILTAGAFVPYIIDILRRRTVPNRATWFIWTIVSCMILASYRASGATHTIWIPVTYAAGPFIITSLAMKYGEGGWSRFDQFCLLLASFSLVIWWLFNSPLYALLVQIFIDFLGLLPTLRKVVWKPWTESRLAWFLGSCGNTLNLFAIEEWGLAIAALPLYMAISCTCVFLLTLRQERPRQAELA